MPPRYDRVRHPLEHVNDLHLVRSKLHWCGSTLNLNVQIIRHSKFTVSSVSPACALAASPALASQPSSCVSPIEQRAASAHERSPAARVRACGQLYVQSVCESRTPAAAGVRHPALLECAETVTLEQEAQYRAELAEALQKTTEKRDRVAQFLTHCESQAELAKAEIKRLQDRRQFFERAAERERLDFSNGHAPDPDSVLPYLKDRIPSFKLARKAAKGNDRGGVDYVVERHNLPSLGIDLKLRDRDFSVKPPDYPRTKAWGAGPPGRGFSGTPGSCPMDTARNVRRPYGAYSSALTAHGKPIKPPWHGNAPKFVKPSSGSPFSRIAPTPHRDGTGLPLLLTSGSSAHSPTS